jgi:hypothetical protein
MAALDCGSGSVGASVAAVCRRLGMTHLGRTTRYYDTTKELFEKLPG